jgi:hypothetical protein
LLISWKKIDKDRWPDKVDLDGGYLDNPEKTGEIRDVTYLALSHQRGGGLGSKKSYESGRRIPGRRIH